jgi:hypothetical protein
MKIVIGINNYKEEQNLNHREKLCVESLCKIKDLFSNVKLINLTFKDEQFATLTNFHNLHCLEYIPKNITNKKIPFVNEIFDILANINSDYFLFVNNDIVVSDRYIKTILNNNYDCYPASKLHFTKLDSLNDENSIPESFSVHGFDGFAIKNKWWLQNREKFKPMLLSCPYWDTYFYGKCQIYGNCLTLNKPPGVIFHLEHQSTSCTTVTEPGNQFNEKNFVEDSDLISQRWFSYVYDVLLKRPTVNNIKWYQPLENEEELEKKYFKP